MLWLKPYIDFNTQKRAQAKHEFEKANVKLMNNSVLGKCKGNGQIMKLTKKEQIAVKCFPKTPSRALAILTVYIW